MSEVAAKVTKIIVDQLGVSAEEVKPEASFPRLSKEYP